MTLSDVHVCMNSKNVVVQQRGVCVVGAQLSARRNFEMRTSPAIAPTKFISLRQGTHFQFIKSFRQGFVVVIILRWKARGINQPHQQECLLFFGR